ncbi:MAG: hypothetical protein ABI972_14530 [Acidobacteriota bacterium]
MSVDLGAPWSGAAAWASISGTGSIELELYDHSEQAAQSLGGDVAWIYTIDAAEIPRLLELFCVPDTHALLHAFAERFDHIHQVRDYLKAIGVPFDEKFDSQA